MSENMLEIKIGNIAWNALAVALLNGVCLQPDECVDMTSLPLTWLTTIVL